MSKMHTALQDIQGNGSKDCTLVCDGFGVLYCGCGCLGFQSDLRRSGCAPRPALVSSFSPAPLPCLSCLLPFPWLGPGLHALCGVGWSVPFGRSVTCVGYTDLPSRLPQTSSQLYANNIAKLILATGPQTTKKKGVFYIDHEDPVSRGMLVVEDGKVGRPSEREQKTWENGGGLLLSHPGSRWREN